jgi:hypothetical protein
MEKLETAGGVTLTGVDAGEISRAALPATSDNQRVTRLRPCESTVYVANKAGSMESCVMSSAVSNNLQVAVST